MKAGRKEGWKEGRKDVSKKGRKEGRKEEEKISKQAQDLPYHTINGLPQKLVPNITI